MIRYVLPIAASLIASTGTASAWCIEPSAPSCASNFGSFTDQFEFDICKSDMESYRSQLEEFARCRQREVDEANETAKRAVDEAEEVARKARDDVQRQSLEYENAVSSFNRRAGG